MAETGVRVTAKRRFGQFMIMQSPTVEIDGVAAGQARWGQPTFFPTTPGRRRLAMSFRYLGRPRIGPADLEVDVAPDQTVDVLYRSPWIVLNKGSLTRT